jgi:hypothetical protein
LTIKTNTVSITKISPVKCSYKSSGFIKNLFQHVKFKVHLQYKVQSTNISTCVINQNGRQTEVSNDNDDNNDNDHKDDNDPNNDKDKDNHNNDNDNDNDNDDDDDKNYNNGEDNINVKKSGLNNIYISGEIIPILFFIAKFNCRCFQFNQTVILLDLECFRFVKYKLCRPYVALWLFDDDNDTDNDNKVNNDDDNDSKDDDNNNDRNNNANDNDNNNNNNNNNQKYFNIQVEIIIFSNLVSWLSILLLKAGDIAENPGPVIRSKNIRNIFSFRLVFALLFVYSVKLGENEEKCFVLIL